MKKMDNAKFSPSNRVREFFERMAAKTKSGDETATAAPTLDLELLAEQAIEKFGGGRKGAEICRKIGKNKSNLNKLNDRAMTKPTAFVLAFCRELFIDPKQFVAGKLVAVPKPAPQLTDSEWADVNAYLAIRTEPEGKPIRDLVMKLFEKKRQSGTP